MAKNKTPAETVKDGCPAEPDTALYGASGDTAQKKPKLKPIVKNTLVSTGVLILISVVAVALLALANAFFPKYVPKLDLETVKILNGLAPTGEDNAQKLLDGGYFVAVPFKQKDSGDRAVAVYKADKGDSAGTVFVETSTYGFKSYMTIVTAISPDKKFIKLYLRDYFDDASIDVDRLNAELSGKTVVANGDFSGSILYGGSAASGTPRAFTKAISLAFDAAREVPNG
jgi:hypothetical protein